MAAILVSAGTNLAFWDEQTLSKTAAYQKCSPPEVLQCNSHWNSVVLSGTGENLACAEKRGEEVKVLNLSKESGVLLASTCAKSNANYSSCDFLMGKNRYILAGGSERGEGICDLWDMKSHTVVKTYTGYTSSVTCVSSHASSSQMLSGCQDGSILHHLVAHTKPSKLLKPPSSTKEAVNDIVFSPFQQSLATSCHADGSITFWSVESNRQLSHFAAAHSGSASHVCFSPFNRMLLASCGTDSKLVFYDILQRKSLSKATTSCPLFSLRLLNDGTTLVGGGGDGKLHVYDLRKCTSPRDTVPAHTSPVFCLALSTAAATTSAGGGGGGKPRRSSRHAKSSTPVAAHSRESSVSDRTSGTSSPRVGLGGAELLFGGSGGGVGSESSVAVDSAVKVGSGDGGSGGGDGGSGSSFHHRTPSLPGASTSAPRTFAEYSSPGPSPPGVELLRTGPQGPRVGTGTGSGLAQLGISGGFASASAPNMGPGGDHRGSGGSRDSLELGGPPRSPKERAVGLEGEGIFSPLQQEWASTVADSRHSFGEVEEEGGELMGTTQPLPKRLSGSGSERRLPILPKQILQQQQQQQGYSSLQGSHLDSTSPFSRTLGGGSGRGEDFQSTAVPSSTTPTSAVRFGGDEIFSPVHSSPDQRRRSPYRGHLQTPSRAEQEVTGQEVMGQEVAEQEGVDGQEVGGQERGQQKVLLGQEEVERKEGNSETAHLMDRDAWTVRSRGLGQASTGPVQPGPYVSGRDVLRSDDFKLPSIRPVVPEEQQALGLLPREQDPYSSQQGSQDGSHPVASVDPHTLSIVVDLFQSKIDEAMEDHRIWNSRQIMSLYSDILRQFAVQEKSIKNAFSQIPRLLAENHKQAEEIETLKAEIQRLKTPY